MAYSLWRMAYSRRVIGVLLFVFPIKNAPRGLSLGA